MRCNRERDYQVGEQWFHQINQYSKQGMKEIILHDCYAIPAFKQQPGLLRMLVVGHLPQDISRFTRFIILYDAVVSAKVVDEKYRRSPLIQGGLEIPAQVSINMEYSDMNKRVINKYEALTNEHYKKSLLTVNLKMQLLLFLRALHQTQKSVTQTLIINY